MKTQRIKKNLSGINKHFFISWHAQHFRKVAGAALSQGQVQISWQAQHFRKR